VSGTNSAGEGAGGTHKRTRPLGILNDAVEMTSEFGDWLAKKVSDASFVEPGENK